MTVAHIITGLGVGGAETILSRMCRADTANRHCVISLSGDGNYGPILRDAGIAVHSLAEPSGRLTLGGLLALRRLLKEIQPDVVQTWLYHADVIGGVMARLAGVRRVHWGIRSSRLIWTRDQRLTILIRLLAAGLSWFVPQTIVCNSERAARLHRSIGYCGKKLRVIPNGVDIERFRPDPGLRASCREAWRVPERVPVLGSVGRYSPYKDYTSLLSALADLTRTGRPFHCVFVGQGMEETNAPLVADIERFGLRDRVRLCGPQSDIPRIMNGLDVLVLSSVAEGFPGVLIEAMACGVPCAVTDVGDARAIVGETGWSAPPSEPSALSMALEKALTLHDDEAAWDRRAAACRARVAAHYTLHRMIAAFVSAWESPGPEARVSRA